MNPLGICPPPSPQRADREFSDFMLGVVMDLVHHPMGAARRAATEAATGLRMRRRDAEVALAATMAKSDKPDEPAFNPNLAAPAANADAARHTRIIQNRTSKGQTRYLLQRLPGGLYVERQHSGGTGAQTLQTVIFRGRQGFAAWCDEDPLRFDEPHLITRVRSAGLDFLQT